MPTYISSLSLLHIQSHFSLYLFAFLFEAGSLYADEPSLKFPRHSNSLKFCSVLYYIIFATILYAFFLLATQFSHILRL